MQLKEDLNQRILNRAHKYFKHNPIKYDESDSLDTDLQEIIMFACEDEIITEDTPNSKGFTCLDQVIGYFFDTTDVDKIDMHRRKILGMLIDRRGGCNNNY